MIPSAVQPAAGTPAPAPTPIRPVYDGTLAELYGIYLRHLLLMIVTLGWSRFWGRTRLRRYLWSHLSVLGDRFEYRGRGLELFLGFVLVMLILLGLAGVAWLIWSLLPSQPLSTYGVGPLNLLPLLIALVGFPLAFVGHYAGLRYKLSRTRWRGIRLGMAGSAWAYGARAAFFTFANAMSAQLLMPVVSVNLAQPRIANARIGTQGFLFAGRAADIYGRYIGYYFLNIAVWIAAFGVTALLLGVGASQFEGKFEDAAQIFTRPGPTAILLLIVLAFVFYAVFGLLILPVRCWWQAYLLRYLVSRTRAGDMLFATGITTKQMWGFMVLNYLILLLSLGLGWPWVMHRTLRLIANELWIYGAPDGSAIRQPTDLGPRYGEGLLDVFDVGAV